MEIGVLKSTSSGGAVEKVGAKIILHVEQNVLKRMLLGSQTTRNEKFERCLNYNTQ